MNKNIELLKNNKSGYTFVELLVVIVIMAVLVAASANYLFAQGGSKARDTERKNDLNQVAALLEQFTSSYGEAPNEATKSRKLKTYTTCQKVAQYDELMACFGELNYVGGDGLVKLAEEPKQGIENDKGNVHTYLYKGTSTGWKLCTLLENQNDPDLNDDYDGSGKLGDEGSRTYCMVSSNRNLTDITGVKGNDGVDWIDSLNQ